MLEQYNMLAWMPGTTEWVVILIVALLIFGNRLPNLARNVGKSLNEFKKGLSEAKDGLDSDVKQIKDDVAKEVKKSAEDIHKN